MKGKRKKKNRTKYFAEYQDNELNLRLERVSLRTDLTDHLEVGVFLANFREAGLGSSRELGRLFKRSPTTVINKDRLNGNGSKGLIDSRGQKKQYKMEEIREEVFYIWAKNPLADDREILQSLQPRLSSLGMGLDLKTLKRFITDTGINGARSRLRAEEFLDKRNPALPDNNGNAEDSSPTDDEDQVEEKEIIQTHSRYAGQMLHVPQLYQMNFPRMMDVLTEPDGCVYSKERVAHMLYFLYASGERRCNLQQ